jgi:hypothetical protein
MAGDIGIREQAIILPAARSFSATAVPVQADAKRRVVHVYGSRVVVAEAVEETEAGAVSFGAEAFAVEGQAISEDVRASLAPDEQLGLEAFGMRQSAEYRAAKAARPHDGADWDFGTAGQPACHDIAVEEFGARSFNAGAPTSSRLNGSVAVGIVIVEGPNANLKFSEAERVKVVAEVQNGLGWLATQNPEGLTFKYDIQFVSLTTKPGSANLTDAQKEALWRDPAMGKLGFGSGMAGVTAYVESIRQSLGTTWGYCAFFTKYPLGWFAYASIGGPRMVMDYANDGWGPDNIDRVFAHETGHIFGAPDEYASSNCSCGGSWGFYGKPNGNCANCAPGGGVECLMKGNTWNMCSFTPSHLGFPLVGQTYSGVWRGGTGAYHLWVNASWNSFVAKWQELAGKNLRLHDLKITREGGVEKFHGVWRAGTGGYYLWVNASWNSFVAKWKELAKQNLRLVDIEVQNVNGTLLYSGVWLPGSDGYYLWANADWNSFKAKWEEVAKQNLRLVDLKILNVGGQQRFFGVWRQGTGGYHLWVNADWNNFKAKWEELAKQNLRLVDLEILDTPQGRRYSGCWLPGTDAYYLWVGADWQGFRAKWEELATNNLRLIDLEVVPAAGAQSSLPQDAGGRAPEPKTMAHTAFAGRPEVVASNDQEEDGMGGGSEDSAAPEDDGTGYGGGTGASEPASPARSSGTDAGLGGGSLAGGSAPDAAPSGMGGGDPQGSGGANAQGESHEGFGGGSLS